MRALTSPLDHFRRHRRDRAGERFAGTAGQLRRHADRQVAGEALRHLDLQFELGQVDHAQHRRVGGDVGVLRHLHLADLADLAVERRAQSEQIDLSLHLGDHRALALGEQALVARVQAGALGLQAGILLRMAHRDVGLLQRVLRLGQFHLRHCAAVVAALVAFQVAAGGLPLDLRLVHQLAGIGAGQHRIQVGAAGFGFQAGQRGLFQGQLAAQFGAVDLGQCLALPDHVAGDHLQGHGAAGDRVQGGAVGGDQAPVGGDVADQVAAADRGDTHALRVEGTAAGDPAARGESNAEQHRQRDQCGPEPAAPDGGGAGAGENLVLGGSVADHRSGRRSGE
ncbi:hypothetical protein XTPLMG730_0803 [Xanthomonas translucens pv. phlei]|uniref:Uncharacterized protein n=1 Tax=Xanthomonas graminis pv. phlei TaxID=487906 RepID=A0A0K2ZFK7_9XANT|nr:hypothetical protein XTPLMG730_0803 [Xanthomonas translucens pv. phlei]